MISQFLFIARKESKDLKVSMVIVCIIQREVETFVKDSAACAPLWRHRRIGVHSSTLHVVAPSRLPAGEQPWTS